MTGSFPALLCAALLAACAAQPAPPAPAPAPAPPPVVRPPAPVVNTPPPAPPVSREVEGLLAYHATLRQLPHVELVRELESLNMQPPGPRLSLQKAMILGLIHGNGDYLRAQLYADAVANSNEPAAQPLKTLAQLLGANYAELRRLSEQIERLGQQNRESQRRIEQLNDMLEGLKAIERTLPVRPSGAVPGRLLP